MTDRIDRRNIVIALTKDPSDAYRSVNVNVNIVPTKIQNLAHSRFVIFITFNFRFSHTEYAKIKMYPKIHKNIPSDLITSIKIRTSPPRFS